MWYCSFQHLRKIWDPYDQGALARGLPVEAKPWREMEEPLSPQSRQIKVCSHCSMAQWAGSCAGEHSSQHGTSYHSGGN